MISAVCFVLGWSSQFNSADADSIHNALYEGVSSEELSDMAEP